MEIQPDLVMECHEFTLYMVNKPKPDLAALPKCCLCGRPASTRESFYPPFPMGGLCKYHKAGWNNVVSGAFYRIVKPYHPPYPYSSDEWDDSATQRDKEIWIRSLEKQDIENLAIRHLLNKVRDLKRYNERNDP